MTGVVFGLVAAAGALSEAAYFRAGDFYRAEVSGDSTIDRLSLLIGDERTYLERVEIDFLFHNGCLHDYVVV